jgi:hypothetical protein
MNLESFKGFKRFKELHTVPTRSLETRGTSFCKKLIFAAFPKSGFLTEGIEIFFKVGRLGGTLFFFTLQIF